MKHFTTCSEKNLKFKKDLKKLPQNDLQGFKNLIMKYVKKEKTNEKQ